MILIRPQYLPALAQSRLLRLQFTAGGTRGAGPARPAPQAPARNADTDSAFSPTGRPR